MENTMNKFNRNKFNRYQSKNYVANKNSVPGNLVNVNSNNNGNVTKGVNFQRDTVNKNINTNQNKNTNPNQNKNNGSSFQRNQPANAIPNKSVNVQRNTDLNKNLIPSQMIGSKSQNNSNPAVSPDYEKIEHQISDILSLQTPIKDEMPVVVNSAVPVKKSDFAIGYKDKTYTYVIPEQLINKEKGLPFWLRPVHVRLIPNDASILDFCNEVFTRLSETGARVEVDNHSDNLVRKIKSSEQDNVPYTVVIGPREKSIHKFMVRSLDGSQKQLSVGHFVHVLEEQLANKPKAPLQKG
jgi:hypothetical protein